MSSALLTCFTFSAQAQVTANGVHAVKTPVGMQIVGLSVYPEAFTGSPTGFNVDIQVAAADVITAVAANTALTAGEWKSTHFGGSNAVVDVPAGSLLEVDINLVAGTSPTADYEVVIWVLLGTK